jgi:predicted RNA binding protein YcfA (HicA-like mRNA interferase family)
MRLPRDLSGDDLIAALERLGYEVVRQKGSHVRLVRTAGDHTHRITIPRHTPLRIGTLNALLNDVAQHLGIPRDDLIARLQGGHS